MKNEGLRTLTSEEEQNQGRKSLGNEVWSEREVIKKRERHFLSREIDKK